MALTTKCPNCQTVLNLPDGAEGRRLKCPKCATKFEAGKAESRPRSSAPGVATAGPASSLMVATPDPGPARPSRGDLDLPHSGGGDLRDTFDPGLLFGDEPKKARPATRETADAAALFDDNAAPKRRVTGGDARKNPRRCPSCGGVVPAGMSLCQRCGLDIDTGRREAVDEMLDDVPPPMPVSSGPPIGIALIGAMALLTSALLAIFSMVKLPPNGGVPLAVVCLFGVFASVQFLRGKTARLLLTALLIGGVIDIIGLIIMPAIAADREAEAALVEVTGDDEVPKIRPIDERIDFNKIVLGLVILGVDAAAFVYISTAGVRRHFDRARPAPFVPLGG